MKFNLQEVIKQNTNEDGVINFEAVQSAIDNDYVNPIVAKKKPNMEELEAKAYDKAKDDFIKELNIDGVENKDSLIAHINTLKSDELQVKYSNLETEKNELENKVKELETNYNSLNNEYTTVQRKSTINEVGFNSKYSKAIMIEADEILNKAKESGEEIEFKDALSQVKENYPEWATDYKPNKGNPIETNDSGADDEVEAMAKIFNS